MARRRAALDVAVFQYANRQGFAALDFGFASSRLSDPRFVHRRRLGCTFNPTPSSPALMLTVKSALRPTLFGRAPLLTGEPAAFQLQAGALSKQALQGIAVRAE